jgi:Fe-S cluster biogenesis protein NfuA
MNANVDDGDFRGRIGRIETLIEEIERFADPAAQDRAREIVQALLEFHGVALAALVGHVAKAGASGRAIMESIARDELTSNLLLLHDLHPHDLGERVGWALNRVRPRLATHGGDVELLGVDEGVVRLRMTGSCHGCPSSAATLRQTIETAIYDAAPDVAAIEVEGVAEPSPLASLPIVTIGAPTLSRIGDDR